QVDVVVGVVADGVPGRGEVLQPAHVLLLECAAEREEVDQPAAVLRGLRGPDGVLLRVGVEVALAVVPLGHAALRVLRGHLQVERDGDERLALGRERRDAGGRGERAGGGRGEEPAAGDGRGHGYFPLCWRYANRSRRSCGVSASSS